MVIYLERGADLHMAQLTPLPLTVSCFNKIQIGFTFLVPAHLGSPGDRAIPLNGCVCVCVLLFMYSSKTDINRDRPHYIDNNRPNFMLCTAMRTKNEHLKILSPWMTICLETDSEAYTGLIVGQPVADDKCTVQKQKPDLYAATLRRQLFHVLLPCCSNIPS